MGYTTLKTVNYFLTTFFKYPSCWRVHFQGDLCTWCFFDTTNTTEQILPLKHGFIKTKECTRTSRWFTMKRSWFSRLQNTINWLFKAQWVPYFCVANYIMSPTCIFFKWVKKHEKSENNWTKFGCLYTDGVVFVLLFWLMINTCPGFRIS